MPSRGSDEDRDAFEELLKDSLDRVNHNQENMDKRVRDVEIAFGVMKFRDRIVCGIMIVLLTALFNIIIELIKRWK